VHDICRQNLNVVFAIDRAGFVGADGETHQGLFDIAFLRSIPNMVLMMPKDENELRHMLKTALDYDGGPIAVRYPRVNGVGVKMDKTLRPIPIGTWEVVRNGESVAVLALGPMVQLAEQAAQLLQPLGISVRIVNARFIKPLDEEMLLQLAREGFDIVTVEEGARLGGMGSAVLEFYSDRNIHDIRVKNIAVPDYFVQHGSVGEQRREVGLTAENLAAHIQSILQERNKRSGVRHASG